MPGQAEDDPAEVDGFRDIPPAHHRLSEKSPLFCSQFPQSMAKLLTRHVTALPRLFFRRAIDPADRIFQPRLNEMVCLDWVYPQVLDHQFEDRFDFHLTRWRHSPKFNMKTEKSPLPKFLLSNSRPHRREIPPRFVIMPKCSLEAFCALEYP